MYQGIDTRWALRPVFTKQISLFARMVICKVQHAAQGHNNEYSRLVSIVAIVQLGGWGLLRGCLAISCVVVGDCRLYWWWPLVVAGKVWESHAYSWRRKPCLCYMIKQPYYSVHMYMCIREIYVITTFI